MFEKLTQEERDNGIGCLHDDLTDGLHEAREAAARFFEAIASDPTADGYLSAFRTLSDALGGQWRWGLSEGPLRLLDGRAIIDRVFWYAEGRRRADGYKNPLSPLNKGDWGVAEHLLDNVDKPTPFADLRELCRDGSWSRLSGTAAMDLVARVATANLGRLAPARTKLYGKVAYVLRESDEMPTRWGGEVSDRWDASALPELAAV